MISLKRVSQECKKIICKCAYCILITLPMSNLPFFNYNHYYALYYIENALKTRFVCNSTYWPRHKFTASTCRVLKIET